MVELSNRMQAVAAFVKKGTVVCDVGCDHGFVSIYLVENQICPRVLAMDVRTGPLKRAMQHIQQAELNEYIETRLSDGLKELETGEAEAAILAGMGGRLMIKILTDSIDKVRRMDYLVLQPQSELSYVRSWLREQGFVIENEDMVLEDGKYYPVMQVQIQQNLEKENDSYFQSLQDEFGPCLMRQKHPVLCSYLDFWEEHQRNILEQVARHPRRRMEIEERLRRIRDARKVMES